MLTLYLYTLVIIIFSSKFFQRGEMKEDLKTKLSEMLDYLKSIETHITLDCFISLGFSKSINLVYFQGRVNLI